MWFFGPRSLARSAPLATVTVLLFVGVFLTWLGDGPEAPGSLVAAHHSQVHRVANGDGHPPTGSYLPATGDEAKDADKRPVNADLLTVLLLACFFGAIVGWLLSNAPGPEAFRSSSITRRPSFLIAREDAPFLGVFRL